MVVSNTFYFPPLLGEMIQFRLSNIFQMGWNHHLDGESKQWQVLARIDAFLDNVPSMLAAGFPELCDRDCTMAEHVKFADILSSCNPTWYMEYSENIFCRCSIHRSNRFNPLKSLSVRGQDRCWDYTTCRLFGPGRWKWRWVGCWRL